MSGKLKAALSHGAVAFLYALGLTLVLLGVTGLLRHAGLAAGLLLGGCAVCGAVTGRRLWRRAASARLRARCG